MTDVLTSEYETLVHELDEHPSEEQLISALVQHADWTTQGAEEVARLARLYGTNILRDTLALAAALDIQDGEAGL